MKILMVLTSHDRLGDTGDKTGFWLEEFVAPYYRFLDAGAEVTLASPLGGQPPIDPKSDDESQWSEAVHRFKADPTAQEALAHTQRLDQVVAGDFDAVFYPGGHGPLWDLAENADSRALIETFAARDKPVGAVCHAPAVFRHATRPDGRPLVAGLRVTGFTNSEEDAVGLTGVVPFLVQDMLTDRGAKFDRGADWASHTVTDGTLVTGQNPASSAATADGVLVLLRQNA